MKPIPKSTLKSFSTQVYSQITPTDFTIRSGKYQWAVHKSVITSKSKFFLRMTDSSFKEAADSTVNLTADDPKLVARLILFCYSNTGQYAIELDKKDDEDEVSLRELLTAGQSSDTIEPEALTEIEFEMRAELHLNMNVLADKYAMPELESYSQKCLDTALRTDTTAFWRLTKRLDGLPEAAEVVLESKLVQHSRAEHMNFLHDARFKQVMVKRPQMAWKMIKGTRSSTSGYGPVKGYGFAKSTAIRLLNLDNEEVVREHLGEYACWALSIIKDQSTEAYKVEFGDLDLAAAALELAGKHRAGERHKSGKPPKFEYAT